jgi:hypothetical protein
VFDNKLLCELWSGQKALERPLLNNLVQFSHLILELITPEFYPACELYVLFVVVFYY